MPNFHRFTQPAYFGAPVLPAGPSTVSFNGVNYNLLNVVTGGTGGGGSAFADAAKVGGPNVGTYFVAFGEDATSSNANRGILALGENTDVLDDYLNRELAVPVQTVDTTAVAPVPSIVLPIGTFVGNVGGYPLDKLFTLTDDLGRELTIAPFFAKISVASISGAVVGTGFSAGAVTLNLSASIPIGQTYRVYYATRASLATVPVDVFTSINIRSAEEIPAEIQAVLASIQSVGGLLLWNDPPTSTLYDLAYSGLNERYRRGSLVDSSNPAEHPVALTLDSFGSGSWYRKNGPGMTAYSTNNVGVTTSEAVTSHLFGASWAAYQADTFSPANDTERMARNSGFVFVGRSDKRGDSNKTPGLYSFLHTSQVGDPSVGLGVNNIGIRTQIRPGNSVTLSGATITLGPNDRFRADFGSGFETDITMHMDILRIDVAGIVHSFVIESFTTSTSAVIANLDGSIPSFGGGTPGTVVDWQKVMLSVSDNATESLFDITGSTSIFNTGLYYNSELGVAGEARPARFIGSSSIFSGPTNTNVISWGYRNPTTGVLTNAGVARANGTVFTPVLKTGGYPAFEDISGTTAPQTFVIRRSIGDTDIGYDSTQFAKSTTTPALISTAVSGGAGYGFRVSFRPHNNACILSQVKVWFAATTHAGLPANPVQVTVKRMGTFTALQTNASISTANLHTGAPQVHSLPILSNYSDKLQVVTVTCDQNNVIDNDDYEYYILINDEGGANAVAGNAFLAIDFTFTNILNMAPY